MDNYARTLILLSESKFTTFQKVQLIELIMQGLEIDTIQGMANKEGKTYNGIKKSNRYYKLKIGGQTMAIKGLKDDKFPF